MEPLQDGDPRHVGRFEVVGRIGSGGMGRVYLATTESGERFALKMIHNIMASDPHFRRRFHREVVAAQRVTGPNTAALVDADPDGDPPWMAVEYVDGPTLSQLIDGGGPLTLPSMVRLAVGMSNALVSIHGAGLVHRDLKPSNVMLGPEGAMLIDFGIAQATDGSMLTATGLVTGSPGFMSPEQAQAEQVTEASDIFALGAVLFFAATGHRPFGEGSLISVTYRVVHAEPDYSDIRDDGLRTLIADCLSKEPENRPTPQEILDRCPAILDGTWQPAPGQAIAGYGAPGGLLENPYEPQGYGDAQGYGEAPGYGAVDSGALNAAAFDAAAYGSPRTGSFNAGAPGTGAFPAGGPGPGVFPPGPSYGPPSRPGPPPRGSRNGGGGGGLMGWVNDLRHRYPRGWLALPAAAVVVVLGGAALALSSGGGGDDQQTGPNDDTSVIATPSASHTKHGSVPLSTHSASTRPAVPVTGPTTKPTPTGSQTLTPSGKPSASVTQSQTSLPTSASSTDDAEPPVETTTPEAEPTTTSPTATVSAEPPPGGGDPTSGSPTTSAGGGNSPGST